MGSQDLLQICASAFAMVFSLLAFLALVMRIITAIFPEKISKTDETILAAMVTVVSTVYPGTKITKVEEIK